MLVTATSADRELAREAILTEEQPSFGALVQRHAARVWRSLRYLGVPEADLADASQEVFLVVHRRLPEFRGEAKLETWIYGICLGVARNWRRKQARADSHVATHMPSAEDVAAATQELELERKHMRVQLQWALGQLCEQQREVFVLHEIEELGMHAIARAVGCPLFTAYSRLRLARKNLGRLLEQASGVV